jgi:hypothetical protein
MQRCRTISLCLALVALLASTARAEEAAGDGQSNERGRQVARWVLAGHTKTATAAEELLLRHLESGSLSAAFRRGFVEGLAAQPGQRDRLLDRWIARAEEDGDAAQPRREAAVQLLGLAGQAGVRRLVEALRRNRSGQAAPQTADDGSAIRPQEAEPLASSQTPQVYDVNFLAERGTPAGEIVKLLRVVASATEVEPLGEQYVVVAGRGGHKRLHVRLNELRNTQAQQELATPGDPTVGQTAGPITRPATGSSDARARPSPPGARTAPGGVKGPGPQTPTAPRQAPTAPPSAGVTPQLPEMLPWIVTSRVIRVPRHADLADQMARWPGIDATLAATLLGRAGSTTQVAFAVCSREEMKAWQEAAPRLRGAETRQGRPLRVPHESEARGFVGRNMPYRRSVERADNGAWRVAQDFLPVGLEFRVRIDGLVGQTRAQVEARLLDLSGPMTPTQVRPEKGAEPIELDQVEWNRNSRHARFALAGNGAGAMLVIPHPSDEEGAWALLLLDFEVAQAPDPITLPGQQMGFPRNGAVGPDKPKNDSK